MVEIYYVFLYKIENKSDGIDQPFRLYGNYNIVCENPLNDIRDSTIRLNWRRTTQVSPGTRSLVKTQWYQNYTI